MEANEVWYSEYELRQFIDMAVRWNIEAIFKNRTDKNPFSVFDNYVKNARENFELFSKQLNKKLTNSPNWKAIEIDVKDRFLPMIENYQNWYKEHKPETEKFEPNNPYSLMLSVIESTKKEILKYFPDPKGKGYNSFDALFEDAVHFGAIGAFKNQQSYAIGLSRYQIEFNLWLQETKGWEYCNDEQYRQLLTKDNWIEFLLYQKQLDSERQMQYEAEKKSWQIVRPERTRNTEEQWESLIEQNALQSFLSVPAPDILHKNAFWHDENDLPIDCNIYHPKYGYNGFEAPTKDVVVTSFQPVTVYRNEKTGKYIYCQYYWPMLCTADELSFINKDGARVIKVDYLQTHQTRLAESEQDFGIMYQREFKQRELPDEPAVTNVFCEQLISHVKDLQTKHKKRSSFEKDRDINVLALADKFIHYLKELMDKSQTAVSEGTESTIKAPVIALFCWIINDAGVRIKEETEGIEAFCKRICSEYDLRYSDRVRQCYNGSNTKRNIEKIQTEILPKIEKDCREKLDIYLQNKQHTSKRLYG